MVEERPSKNRDDNVTKIYCARCDRVFESRERFEGHLGVHASARSDSDVCETCPIDAAIARIVRFLRHRVRPGSRGA